MKQLKNCVKLTSQVKIYVPSTVDVDKNFDNSEYVQQTLKFLSECFGGATATKALGAWISTKGQLVTEHVDLVFSFAKEKDLEESIDKIYNYCLKMKLDLRQESISLEVNNELYFV